MLDVTGWVGSLALWSWMCITFSERHATKLIMKSDDIAGKCRN